MDVERMKPETKLADLTVGDLIDVIGWALTYYRSAQGEDVAGFAIGGPRLQLPPLNQHWRAVQSSWWTVSDSDD